jgi:integrase
MNDTPSTTPISPLRQRLIDDMNVRRFSPTTQRNYIRDVGRLATFLGRSPDTATVEDLHRFQVEQREAGVPVPTMNSIVSALRFFFTHTLDRPDLARRLVRVMHPRKMPAVLSPDEVARLLNATTCLKHQAALSVAYGAGLRVAEVSALKVSDVDQSCPRTGTWQPAGVVRVSYRGGPLTAHKIKVRFKEWPLCASTIRRVIGSPGRRFCRRHISSITSNRGSIAGTHHRSFAPVAWLAIKPVIRGHPKVPQNYF